MSNPTRTAIVTGASRGIGRAIAVGLGGIGFRVAINFNSNTAAADECAALVKQAGGDAITIQGDIADGAARQRIVEETLAKLGAIDLLVNNAGVAPHVRADLLETSEESFDRLMNTNLKGPFFLSQAVARHMVERSAKGAIINITSLSAYTASTNRAEYCISKAGLAMATQVFAARLAPHGINVYEIRPGLIETDMTAPAHVKAKYDKLILEEGLLPLARWGKPEDVAKAVVAIATGALPYSTGQVIDVDGGFHIRRL